MCNSKTKVTQIFSEEKGQYETAFHYRFEKELKMAGTDDDPYPVYAEIVIEHQKPLNNTDRMHRSLAPIQNLKNIVPVEDWGYITPISKEEYDRR